MEEEKKKSSEGYSSPHPKPKYQELSTLSQMIQKCDKYDEIWKLIDENPRRLINVASDAPAILHMGCWYNVMHLCARYNNLEIAKELMRRIQDPSYICQVYATPVNAEATSAVLTDKFLNTPDRTSGRTPLLWALRQGYSQMVMFLTSFVETELPLSTNIEANRCQTHEEGKHTLDCHRVYEALRHPLSSYYVTLYKELNEEELPFFAVTSRFPEPQIPANKKQAYFKHQTFSSSPAPRRRDGKGTPVRLSKFIDGKMNSDSPTIRATTSQYVPHLAVGVFGYKSDALEFYDRLMEDSPRGSPDFVLKIYEKTAENLAETNQYFIFYPNSSGLVVSYEKRQLFKTKLEAPCEEPINDLGELLHDTFALLQLKSPKKPLQASDDTDEEDFHTAPSSPISGD